MIDWPIEIKDNKYSRWYENIIKNAMAKDLPITRRGSKESSSYTEVHHIIPKCFGGSNSSENLVRFSAREHFVCHWLLTKMTQGKDRAKMVTAFIMMMGAGNNKCRYVVKSSRIFEKIKIEYSQILSEKFTGRVLSEETRKKLSDAGKGRTYSDEVNKSKGRKGRLGVVHTKEGLKRISESSKNRICSEETKLKHSINNIGVGNPFYGKKHSQETIEKLKEYQNLPEVRLAKSERLSGDKNPAKRDEVKNKISKTQKESKKIQKELGTGSYNPLLLLKRKELSAGSNNGNSKRFVITDPTGKVTEVIGRFKIFCKEHDLNYSGIMRKIDNNVCHYHGWQIERFDKYFCPIGGHLTDFNNKVPSLCTVERKI